TVNMGFSGNALLDMEIAELMAKVENPALYVLDYVPNASADMIKEHGEEFFRVIRNAHPDVPVIFVEDPIFPYSRLDKKILGEITRKNVEQKSLYERLKTAGEKHIYFVSSEHLIGDDGEATVDGVHFTDLGMVRYADCLTPVIQKALRKAGK
ncbi:MAG: SGNH/GDSL hydrolase family protein, partial [Bacteroidales bacterium]|nr:SGNH/GDSL hydrolase family protein [Bacteroidales bacterium]